MTREEKIIQLEKMLRKVPDALSPMKASRCSPLGKNHIYELIKSGELRAFVYEILTKINFLCFSLSTDLFNSTERFLNFIKIVHYPIC